MQDLLPIELGLDFKADGLRAGEAVKLAEHFAGMEPWSRYPRTPAELVSFFEQEEPLAPRYALRYGGELAGLVVVRKNWLRGPYLQFLGLLAEYQKQGLGGQVLDWLEGCAANDGQRHVWIMVSEFNAAARAFYGCHGYEEISAVPDVVRDGIREILVRKRV